MSNSEIAAPASYNQFTSSACVAGVTALQDLPASYLLGVSRIVGCVRTTVGGTIGNPKVVVTVADPTLQTAKAQVRFASSNAADTSVYTLLWVNEIAGSSVASPLNPSGFPAVSVLGC